MASTDHSSVRRALLVKVKAHDANRSAFPQHSFFHLLRYECASAPGLSQVIKDACQVLGLGREAWQGRRSDPPRRRAHHSEGAEDDSIISSGSETDVRCAYIDAESDLVLLRDSADWLACLLSEARRSKECVIVKLCLVTRSQLERHHRGSPSFATPVGDTCHASSPVSASQRTEDRSSAKEEPCSCSDGVVTSLRRPSATLSSPSTQHHRQSMAASVHECSATVSSGIVPTVPEVHGDEEEADEQSPRSPRRVPSSLEGKALPPTPMASKNSTLAHTPFPSTSSIGEQAWWHPPTSDLIGSHPPAEDELRAANKRHRRQSRVPIAPIRARTDLEQRSPGSSTTTVAQSHFERSSDSEGSHVQADDEARDQDDSQDDDESVLFWGMPDQGHDNNGSLLREVRTWRFQWPTDTELGRTAQDRTIEEAKDGTRFEHHCVRAAFVSSRRSAVQGRVLLKRVLPSSAYDTPTYSSTASTTRTTSQQQHHNDAHVLELPLYCLSAADRAYVLHKWTQSTLDLFPASTSAVPLPAPPTDPLPPRPAISKTRSDDDVLSSPSCAAVSSRAGPMVFRMQPRREATVDTHPAWKRAGSLNAGVFSRAAALLRARSFSRASHVDQ
ncbi:hypothetical protein V8E36_005452 [Tilletia maclaganii]